MRRQTIQYGWFGVVAVGLALLLAASQEANAQVPEQLPDVPAVAQAGNRPVVDTDKEFGFSLMFKSEDIRNLEQVLATIGDKKEENIIEAAPSEDDILAEILKAAQGDEPEVEEVIVEDDDGNAILPAFYLSSIMYRSPGDWSLWVNKQRITAKESDRPEIGISVRGITRETATLAWKPSNIETAIERWEQLKESDTIDDISKMKKHREVAFAKIDFNQEAGEFVVSMRPNQTFFADTMQVLEGKHKVERTIAKEESIVEKIVSTEPAQDRTGIARRDPMAFERGLANQLMDNLKQVGNIVPGGGEQ